MHILIHRDKCNVTLTPHQRSFSFEQTESATENWLKQKSWMSVGFLALAGLSATQTLSPMLWKQEDVVERFGK